MSLVILLCMDYLLTILPFGDLAKENVDMHTTYASFLFNFLEIIYRLLYYAGFGKKIESAPWHHYLLRSRKCA